MTRAGYNALIAVLVLAASLALPAGAWAERDPFACEFTGSVQLLLAPAPAGIRVQAWVGGEKIAETVAISRGLETVYFLALDARHAGKTVIFRFPTYPSFGQAAQATCQVGRRQTVTLNAQTHSGCGGA